VRKIIGYETLANSDLEKMDEYVTQVIDSGWEPFGQLVFVKDGPATNGKDGKNTSYFVQVVVLYED